MNCHYLMPKMSGDIRVCFSHFLWIIATKRSSLILSILDIVSRGWDGISFTSVATASATQRYKDISLPLPLLQTSEIIC